MRGILQGAAHGQVVGDRQVHHAEAALGVVVAKVEVHRRLKLLHRLVGDEIDAAAGAVASIECSLRTAQHFDAADVVERPVSAVVARLINAIDIECDGWIERRGVVVGPYPANVDLSPDVILAELDCRNELCQIAYIRDALLHQRVTGGRSDGHRDLLQILGALLSGDYDFLECVRCGHICRHVCGDGADRYRSRKQYGAQSRRAAIHVVPPKKTIRTRVFPGLTALCSGPDLVCDSYAVPAEHENATDISIVRIIARYNDLVKRHRPK